MMNRILTACTAVLLSAPAMAQNTGIGTITPTDQLHTTGTVRFENYRGPGTRVVQIDSSGRMVVTGAGSIFTATPAAAIADNGCATGNGVTSTITVSGQPTSIATIKISVRVNITHTYDGDVVVFLVAPNGAILRLIEGNGGSSANFTNTVFTDASPNLIGLSGSLNGFPNAYKPKGGLTGSCLLTPTVSTFGAIGGGTINPNGAWTLKVYDNSAAATGTLNRWDLSLSGGESFATAEQNNYIPKLSAGNLVPSVIYQGAATGNVGINTANPAYPFTVTSTGNGIVQSDNISGVDVGLYTNGAGGWLQTYTASPLRFATGGGGAQMSLFTTGDVGIGLSTAPAARLHVATGSPTVLQLENTSAIATGTTTDLYFKNGTQYTGRIGTVATGTQDASLAFYTSTSSTSSTLQKRLSILDGGNIGIGIADASVSEKLHVDGGNIKLGLAQWATTANDRLLKFGDGNFVSIGEAGADDRLQLTAANIYMRTSTGGSPNVGIGNAIPAYTLDVTGTLHSTGQALIGGPLSVNGQTNLNAGLKYTGSTPAAGKVLTSDAIGNATWQTPPQYNTGMALKASTSTIYSSAAPTAVVVWDNANGYDDGGNFSAGVNTYVAPAAGVYHYDVLIAFPGSYAAIGNGYINIVVEKNGGAYSVGLANAVNGYSPNSIPLSSDIKLAAGDALRVSIINLTNGNVSLSNFSVFSVHRVY